jgi:hypothetical protein
MIIDFISYFKHLPEFERIHVDDQVLLIKQNIRFLFPINDAILSQLGCSPFSDKNIQTIACAHNINLHAVYRSLSNSFMQFAVRDPTIMKIFLVILLFTPSFQSIDSNRSNSIHRIQSSYVELLWLYLIAKFSEKQAIDLFMRLTSAYLRLQIIVDKIDSIIRSNDDVHYLDSLMKIVLELT